MHSHQSPECPDGCRLPTRSWMRTRPNTRTRRGVTRAARSRGRRGGVRVDDGRQRLGARVLTLGATRRRRLAWRGRHARLVQRTSRATSRPALDVADAIPQRYRLEVGSPGRRAHAVQRARLSRASLGNPRELKLKEPVARSVHVMSGTLGGSTRRGASCSRSERGDPRRRITRWNRHGATRVRVAPRGTARRAKTPAAPPIWPRAPRPRVRNGKGV